MGGRVLGDGKPKYLNSPETPLFSKSHELYGLHHIRKFAKNLSRIVVVEGYMDVIALAQFGIHYAVATLEHRWASLTLSFCSDASSRLCFASMATKPVEKQPSEEWKRRFHDGRRSTGKVLVPTRGEDPDTVVRSKVHSTSSTCLTPLRHLNSSFSSRWVLGSI